MEFGNWKKELDGIFADFFGGMTSDDFEDWLWYDEFANGSTPRQAFLEWTAENA